MVTCLVPPFLQASLANMVNTRNYSTKINLYEVT